MKTEHLHRTIHQREGPQKEVSWLLMFLFAGVAALAVHDLHSDVGEGAGVAHLLIEAVLLAVGLVGFVVVLRRLLQLTSRAKLLEVETTTLSDQLRESSEEVDALNDQQRRTAAEADLWRQEAKEFLQGLGVAIDKQFEAWALTDAERQVALLMLKGLSHKEIADVRGTSDTTTRQQARSVYKKAGIASRNQLSAFFLEDLLLPVNEPIIHMLKSDERDA